jgi:hypothetical protein
LTLLVINFAAVPNFVNEDDLFFAVEFVDDSVISYSEFVESGVVCGEGLGGNLLKVFGEPGDFGEDALAIAAAEFLEAGDRFWFVFNGVTHGGFSLAF